MRVRILNHNTYGPFLHAADTEMYGPGTIHTVLKFYPDTGEIDLGDKYEGVTFDPSEYEVVEE